MADLKKCAHPSCNCVTAEKYCSISCEEGSDVTDIACQCKHAACDVKPVAVS
jgi:hypothetical protein